MNKDEIRKQLRQLPIEASVAIAVRVGLRVLPWLALSKDMQALARWPEKARAAHLLAVLLAYDVGLMAIWDSKTDGLKAVASARRAAAAATATAYAYAAAAAAAAEADAFAAADAAAAAAAFGIITKFDLQLRFDIEILRKSNEKNLIESPL